MDMERDRDMIAEVIAKLHQSERYEEEVRARANAGGGGGDRGGGDTDPFFQECSRVLAGIENEILFTHNFVRDKYRLSLLPSPTITELCLMASTTAGQPLPQHDLEETLEACDRILALDGLKRKVLEFLEIRMGHIAPNLCAVVGSAVAAKLIGAAGGLVALSDIPACSVQVLGATEKTQAGFVSKTQVVQSTPPALRPRACCLVASKATLAARVDAAGGDPAGMIGRGFLEIIRNKIDKWLVPCPPPMYPKPLPILSSNPRKKCKERAKARQSNAVWKRQFVTDI